MQPITPYSPTNKIRIVTAGSLFDGHDAAINIMRRILQSSGGEVIHLGHNRSVHEIVNTAVQEDAQAIAVTSYQGGHLEFFKYMHDLLAQQGCGHIKIFGGGGGTILPAEADELHAYGITRIYSPDDGRSLGLQGMINDLLQQADFPTGKLDVDKWKEAISEAYDRMGSAERGARSEENSAFRTLHSAIKNWVTNRALARLISAVENEPELVQPIMDEVHRRLAGLTAVPVLGITGTGGAGKSSLVDELVRRFLLDFPAKEIAIVSVDPSKRRTGGALLGDRIRMNSVAGLGAGNERVYMRSLATRQSNLALSRHIREVLAILQAAQFDLIILETSGIGQSDTEIIDFADTTLYVMTPEYGAATQLEKIDMLDFADVIALNKFDKRGAQDALRDVQKQYQRNHQQWDKPVDEMPVYGTIASQFNDPGTNRLYRAVMGAIAHKTGADLEPHLQTGEEMSEKIYIIPPARVRYLSEIAETIRGYGRWAETQAAIADKLYGLQEAMTAVRSANRPDSNKLAQELAALYAQISLDLDRHNQHILDTWADKKAQYAGDEYVYRVRGRDVRVPTQTESLAHTKVPKVTLPRYQGWGDILRWSLHENVPGDFPYTAGVFPFKRTAEDPTRMFAGEGGPERTNKRFHYVSLGMPAKRLSTAFDSVTLYGEDPAHRPDIYGKVGNSGVSIASLDDAKRLYSGFNLCDPATSVSMTINGPAPTMLAFFLNTAVDQQCELYIREHGLEHLVEAKKRELYEERGLQRPSYHGDLPEGNDGLGLLLLGLTGDQVLPLDIYAEIKASALSTARGTVQADILKEDQAQNTCIFSTEFALRLMGDIQQYFIDHRVRNFYSVSISGYHIAEAGANPISQLAFTLANGFTFVEYYLARGMDVNEFAPNFSFFFSNGMDPEYAVIGRVARRIWAKAMKLKYGADERAQKLKYHIQTSGRSLHAQEIGFNDIRTTLQALYAIYDNCNSLHTNAYDEAITTPTEESVRRAMAIQLIINKELGLANNENPLQGAFIIEELTDLVEEAVLAEFDRITERGGVLGAMETMYQRGKIQEESLYYESLKHSGDLPIIGVNTFLSDEGSPTIVPREVIRATTAEKERQIAEVQALQARQPEKAAAQLQSLQQAAIHNENMFTALMEAVKVCSLGQITGALYAVGGQYRRNM
ncbi:MAG: methylmalonyl-CoA mutase family protein [Chloroflexi bacterium]|nr:methylmalonyl-CoA mutase family protein [Chloroflexota bacterium]MBP7045889.1 methylmalonyl-CoA mutase family protein [Chloroflexota bacterium]